MAFVNERIPAEEKAKIDWERFRHGAFFHTHGFRQWTIDRELGAFFIALRGWNPWEPFHIFALCLEDSPIWIETEINYSEGEGEEPGIRVAWKVLKVIAPAHLQPRREEIMAILRRAIFVYQMSSGVSRVDSVEIAFPQQE